MSRPAFLPRNNPTIVIFAPVPNLLGIKGNNNFEIPPLHA
jgi:hypothetical protein